MRRRELTAAFASTTIVRALIGPLAAVADTAAGRVRKTLAVDPKIDGIVIRGTWRARVALGDPSLTLEGTAAALRAATVTRNGTTLTIESSGSGGEPVSEVRATVAQLRGVATSGAVRLAIEDRSGAALFLDLAGSGTVRATGAVALLRVTTSGSVSADLTALAAAKARVHARQSSRLSIRVREELTIVAVDAARVSYDGPNGAYVTSRGRATVIRL